MVTAPKRNRDRRQLGAILALVAWCLVAAAIAHPTPGAALVLVFVAGLVTGGALVFYTDSRRGRLSPRPASRAAARAPRRATARPGPGTPPSRGRAPTLRPVPPVHPGGPDSPDAAAALRATLAARADQVSTHIPAPPEAVERET